MNDDQAPAATGPARHLASVEQTAPRKLSRPTPTMLAALRNALLLERGAQGEPWVSGRYRRTGVACWRRGLATEYRVTPDGRPYYLISDAGRRYVAEHAPVPAVPATAQQRRAVA